MPFDLYGPCPCGSGKKFKWCCQPIHVQISKAFEQDEAGQHEAALQTINEVVAQHPDNPEAHGRKAQLLYQMDKAEEAEAALQKALELNPRYAFGHYLRGRFRHYEGEFAGALVLFRKAADLYDQEAHQVLGQVYAAIAECEMRLNRPVAARAAMQIALRHDPGVEAYRKVMDDLFGDQSHLPLSARREYRFLGAAATASPAQRCAWQTALHTAATGKLSDAARAFETLTEADDSDAAAWYDLGLARAWLGNNAAALAALDRYVSLEADDGPAAAAWALAEVLRCGAGAEDQADLVEHSALFQVRNPRQFVQALEGLIKEKRFIPTQSREEEGALLGLILEQVQALTAELAAKKSPRMAAFLLVIGDLLHLRSVNQDGLMKTVQDLQQRAGGALSEPEVQHGPVPFSDVLSEAAVFPMGAETEDEARGRLEEGVGQYFEDQWIHKPLRGLGGVPPLDAAGHGTLRKKLGGVIQFLEECAKATAQPYDFERLRRKLGLVQAAPGAAVPSTSEMSAAELAGLPAEALSDNKLADAYQAALRLDARELAGRFGKAILGRPPQPGSQWHRQYKVPPHSDQVCRCPGRVASKTERTRPQSHRARSERMRIGTARPAGRRTIGNSPPAD